MHTTGVVEAEGERGQIGHWKRGVEEIRKKWNGERRKEVEGSTGMGAGKGRYKNGWRRGDCMEGGRYGKGEGRNKKLK